MHRQNFDTTSGNSYPLTTDRMAELQDDLQVPLKVLAAMLPEGGTAAVDCILTGCAVAGAAGYALVTLGGVREVIEVRSGTGSYLSLTTVNQTATNAQNNTVTVRVKRYLDWTSNSNGINWANLPRMRVRLAKQDDSAATYCTGGLWWHVPTNGSRLRVQRTGGRVHLQGSVKYGLQLAGAQQVIYTGSWTSIAETNALTKRPVDDIPVLPTGYRPDGDIIVPIRYNGNPSFAVIDSDGQLLLSQEHELGDTLEIDTWLEI